MPYNQFLTMRELGYLFGVSSHVIGRWLVAIGLRTPKKHPSRTALENGYCQRERLNHHPVYFFKWHRGKTVQALLDAGHQLAERPAS